MTDTPIKLKRCVVCKGMFPATTDYFSPDPQRPDGLVLACLNCGKRHVQKRHSPPHANRVPRDHPKGFKYCTKCETIYPATTEYFHRDRSKSDGLHSICAKCRAEKQAQWRKENPEKSKEVQHNFYANHREQVKAEVRAYNTRNREQRNAYENAYWREHKEEKKAKTHRRKARQRNLPDNFTGADWQYCLDYWQHRCAVCGRVEGDGFVLAPDHWIAVMDKRPDNPGTVPDNIVPLCHSDKGSRGGCNNSKHNRDAVTWLVERYGEAQATEIAARVEAYFTHLRTRSLF